MIGFHTLPHELQIQILLNLPPTAIFSLRLVCTSWNTILSSLHTEHAISLSLLFPSTAPDLRSRLLRRTRLLRGDPVQIWDVDEGDETVTLYCDGFVVTSNGRCGSLGRLGIWDCRKKVGEDGCIARVDLTGLVRDRYPELWDEGHQSTEVEQLEDEDVSEHHEDFRTEIPFKLVTQYSWAENGLVLLVLGEPGNPRKPRHPKILLLFSLSTGNLLQNWKLPLSGRVISAHFTPSILLLVTSLPHSADLPGSPPHHITTLSVTTGAQLYTWPIPPIDLPAPPSHPPGSSWYHIPTASYYHNHIALDNADNFCTPALHTTDLGVRTHTYEVRSAHTGALINSIPLSPVNEAVATSNHWRYDSLIFTCPSSRIHHFSTYKPHPHTLPDLLLSSDEEKELQSTTYTHWCASSPHRRTSIILPPLDGFNITGTDGLDMTAYLVAVRWGVVVGEYYHFGKRCWVFNVSGNNNEVVTGSTLPEVGEGLRRCAPLACYLPSTPLEDTPHSNYSPTQAKSWRRFKTIFRAFQISPPSPSRASVYPVTTQGITLFTPEDMNLEGLEPCRTQSPVLPDGVVCRWLPEALRDAGVLGGDDGVWLVKVPEGSGKWGGRKRVWVSWDEGMRLPGRGWMRW